MSWASIAKAAPQPVVAAQDLASSTDGLRLLVVDANAIISGIKLDGIADKAVTVQEVLDEIRDKQSRQFLSSLPYHLQVSEPTEDSIKIVTRFARETGDVAALSTNDIKVLALAHTLEVAAHGSEHLAMHAAQPRMHTKPISSSQAMPGWGTVPNPEDWKVVDEANEADEAAAAASMSRIAQQVQQLSLDPSQPNDFLQDTAAPATPPPAAAAAAGNQSSQQQQVAISSASADLADHHQQQQQQQQQQGPSAAFSSAAADDDDDGGDEDDHDDGDVEEADDGGWEVAASSQAAARRKRRKEYKRQEKQRAFEAEWEEHARIMQQQQQGASAGISGQQQQQEQEQQQDGLQAAADAQAAAADSDDAGSDFSEEDAAGAEDAHAEGDGATNDELLAAEHQVYTADEVGSSEGDDAGNTHSSTAAEPGSNSSSRSQQQQQGLAPGVPGWQSSVACITADFAMQNVLLQMGLRLLTRDGRRIARLSRYALRCSACFTVTREPGRIFCPKCGNMTLDRVEVVVGSDGAEYFGVKKRHVLRGTKYSLPKPRGGRNSKDPVLREDVFLLKVKALGRRAAKKKKAPAAAAGDDDAAAAAAAAGGVDPFAPEYNQDTWHVASQAELAQHRGLAAVLQPAWKNNPNERKLTRSNRRG